MAEPLPKLVISLKRKVHSVWEKKARFWKTWFFPLWLLFGTLWCHYIGVFFLNPRFPRLDWLGLHMASQYSTRIDCFHNSSTGCVALGSCCVISFASCKLRGRGWCRWLLCWAALQNSVCPKVEGSCNSPAVLLTIVLQPEGEIMNSCELVCDIWTTECACLHSCFEGALDKTKHIERS